MQNCWEFIVLSALNSVSFDTKILGALWCAYTLFCWVFIIRIYQLIMKDYRQTSNNFLINHESLWYTECILSFVEFLPRLPHNQLWKREYTHVTRLEFFNESWKNKYIHNKNLMNGGLCIHRKQPKVLHSEACRLGAPSTFYFIYIMHEHRQWF